MIQIYYLIVSVGHVWALASRVLCSGFDQMEIKVSVGLPMNPSEACGPLRNSLVGGRIHFLMIVGPRSSAPGGHPLFPAV